MPQHLRTDRYGLPLGSGHPVSCSQCGYCSCLIFIGDRRLIVQGRMPSNARNLWISPRGHAEGAPSRSDPVKVSE
jgi:hypothetical protein